MENQGEEPKYLTEEYWKRRWEGGKTPWIEVNVNPLLEKYIGLLDGGKDDRKILVPLCGKTFDMKWLFDQGHRVVGVERYKKALEDFFKEHSMEYTVETKNGIPVFTERSGRIVLYGCNIFDFQRTGEDSFDAVWDRGSFGAIKSEERASYVDLLTRLKTQNAVHLLELYDYDDRFLKKAPFSIPMSKVLEYWGERQDVKLIDCEEATKLMQRLRFDLNSFKRSLYLLTTK